MTLRKKSIRILLLALVVAALCVVPAFASSAGNVADAVEQTWTDAAGQIKTVVNTVVFPALTMVLGVAFFVKVAMTYFEYRKHGQIEWTGLILLFAGILHVLPSSGRVTPLLQPTGGTGFFILDTIMRGDWKALGDVLVHLILPTVALSLYSMAIITRMTRSSMLETLNADYIRTARAKGLKKGTVNIKHALRNAMLPISTVIGLQFGSLLGGALLTETVFAWPGIGKFAVDCVLKSDFPVVQGIVLLVAVIFVIMNLVVDIVYAYLDPRIKYGAKEEG